MRNDCKYSTWDFRSPNWSFKRLAWQGFSQDWSRRQVTWFRWVGWVVHSMLCRVKLRLRVWEACGFLAYAPFATPEAVIGHQTPVERQKNKDRLIVRGWFWDEIFRPFSLGMKLVPGQKGVWSVNNQDFTKFFVWRFLPLWIEVSLEGQWFFACRVLFQASS